MVDVNETKQGGRSQSSSSDNRQQQAEQSFGGQQGGSQYASTKVAAPKTENRSLQRGRSGFYGGAPLSLFHQLSAQMDDLFDSFFPGSFRRSRQQNDFPALWSPEIDICEEGNQLRVCVDLPGIPKDAVKIDIHDGALTIHGERSDEKNEESKGKGQWRSERQYGSFYRTIPLPEGANTEAATANMKEGVLEIKIPIPQQKQARRLEIRN